MKRYRKEKFGLYGQARRPRMGNPLFASRTRSTGKSAWAWVRLSAVSILGAAAVGALAWAIWFSPELKIRVIDVKSDMTTPQHVPADAAGQVSEPEIAAPIRSIINDQLNSRRFAFFPQSNIFFFDRRAAEDRISASFYLQKLDVSKKLPDTVTVTVEERPIRAATVSDGAFWALDESGFAVRALYGRELREMKDIPDTYRSLTVPDSSAVEVVVPDANSASAQAGGPESLNIYPLILNLDESPGRRPLKPGEQAFTASVMGMVASAASRLTDICQDRIKWFDVRDSFETVEADMGGGWRVIMSSSLPFDAQAERLSRLLRERLSGDRSHLDYVDLRWGERVFIKDKESEAPAENQ